MIYKNDCITEKCRRLDYNSSKNPIEIKISFKINYERQRDRLGYCENKKLNNILRRREAEDGIYNQLIERGLMKGQQ